MATIKQQLLSLATNQPKQQYTLEAFALLSDTYPVHQTTDNKRTLSTTKKGNKQKKLL